MAQLVAVLIDGLIYSSWLFIIAVGLTLIYGVMKILNIAHGSLYALGAYSAASLAGYWINQGYPPMGSYAVMLVAAILVGLVAGPVIERGLLRFMYGKDEIVLVLVTYAVFLILEDFVKLVWGVDPYFIAEPYGLLGNFTIGRLTYPNYNLVVFGAAVFIGAVLAWVLTKTRQGKMLQAVIHDREMSAAMGINVGRVYFITFTVGAMLGALGRRADGTHDFGATGHRRGDHRARIRRCGNRWPGQPAGSGARRHTRRCRALGRRSLPAGTRPV